MTTPATAADRLTRSPAALIQIDGLRVRFGDRWALDDLSFEVSEGEVVGLIGPNGAGKTTTLSVLATLLVPTAGTAVVAGHTIQRAPADVRRSLGLVPQTLAIYPTLTAWENVLFFARLLGMRGRRARVAAEEALTLVGLEQRRSDVVSTFSGGMQRRLNLACGLLNRPRVLLLDEPTVGVDPQSRERIFHAVRDHAATGAAILYSTHYMEEAERLCDRVVLIDHGRVIATGTPAELVCQASSGLRLMVITRTPLPITWLDGISDAHVVDQGDEVANVSEVGTRVHVTIDYPTVAPRVLERAASLGGEVVEFHLQQPGLRDAFLTLTGRALRD